MHGSAQAHRPRSVAMAELSRSASPTPADASLVWRARCWLDETDGQAVERTEEVIQDKAWGWGWRAWRWPV